MAKHLALSNFACAFLVCLAVLFLFASPALPQSATTGGLTGTVTDPSGGVIAGATVTATSLATGQERSVTTDASGTYKFSLLAAGNYSLKFSASGFKTSEVPSVTVNITETPVLNQKLSQNRAENVVNLLLQQGHVPLARMLAPGAMGETGGKDETAADEAQARRVVVRVLQNKAVAGIS